MPKIIATKNHWIELGYKLFSTSGIQGINVDQMSKVLKCNRSSFYWHFESKSKFLSELIKHWIVKETDRVILETERSQTDKEKLEKFLIIAFKNEPYLEFIFFLKRYAIKKPEIQSIIDDIDEKRLQYTSQLFQNIGYTKVQANIKASIFYKYLIGHHEMIRNKKQPQNYILKVKEELKHFIEI